METIDSEDGDVILSCYEETGYHDCREDDDEETIAYWEEKATQEFNTIAKNTSRQVNATELNDIETTTTAPSTPAPISNCNGCEHEHDGYYSPR